MTTARKFAFYLVSCLAFFVTLPAAMSWANTGLPCKSQMETLSHSQNIEPARDLFHDDFSSAEYTLANTYEASLTLKDLARKSGSVKTYDFDASDIEARIYLRLLDEVAKLDSAAMANPITNPEAQKYFAAVLATTKLEIQNTTKLSMMDFLIFARRVTLLKTLDYWVRNLITHVNFVADKWITDFYPTDFQISIDALHKETGGFLIPVIFGKPTEFDNLRALTTNAAYLHFPLETAHPKLWLPYDHFKSQFNAASKELKANSKVAARINGKDRQDWEKLLAHVEKFKSEQDKKIVLRFLKGMFRKDPKIYSELFSQEENALVLPTMENISRAASMMRTALKEPRSPRHQLHALYYTDFYKTFLGEANAVLRRSGFQVAATPYIRAIEILKSNCDGILFRR